MIIFLVDLPLPYASRPEAYTHREGRCLAQQVGCNRFIIQSDNTQVIETMQDGGFFSFIEKKMVVFHLHYQPFAMTTPLWRRVLQ
jgi:hypothetical protein